MGDALHHHHYHHHADRILPPHQSPPLRTRTSLALSKMKWKRGNAGPLSQSTKHSLSVCRAARLPQYRNPSPRSSPLLTHSLPSPVQLLQARQTDIHSHCLAVIVFPPPLPLVSSFPHHRTDPSLSFSSPFLSLSQNALLCFSPRSLTHSPTQSTLSSRLFRE